ncbi:ATPase [Actinoplanes ianthinogenes]|uniref:ATPase n=1 Tax=Actinoplanes ianthinogenes TaxID=122358 RepID=A0ABM7M602_9ACTN|nr:SRPBCC family protein [Actinoplanes ianthinogenes]BCJ47062.1 ATPase [Actinoplanes ianthinogenes]GGR13556.1 ATPase [Actinoplanes ianthinogenes]
MTVDDQLGRWETDGDAATMTFRRRLPFPIDAVWSAITDPGQRAAWFGETTIDPATGGEITMMPTDPPAAPEAKRMTGRILVWQPPAGSGTAVFEHEWRQRIVEDGVVRYELTADGDGTVLVFTHRGLSVRNAQGFIPGTHAFLDRLAAHLAAEEIPDWGGLYGRLAPAYR